MKTVLTLFHKIGEKPGARLLLQLLVLLSVSILQYAQLHYSASAGYKALISFGPALLNTAILLWLNLAAKLIFQKWHISAAVTSVFTTVWSVVNFYVLKFHGSPLFFSEFASFRTAMNVMGGYHLAWEQRITGILLLGMANLAAAFLLWLCRKRKEPFFIPRNLLLTLGAFAGISVLLWLSLFVWQTPKPRNTVSWTWFDSARDYGYPALIVEDADLSLHYINMPEGYDAAHLEDVKPREAAVPASCPDIILIINETFWDPSLCLELTTDVDCLEAYYSIPGAVYGTAAVPNIGGCTNDTEFEVLTGNSMTLLPRHAPFNYFNMNKISNSAPRYLKALGYRSAAFHCEPGSNYSRSKAYPGMGFDDVYLGRENFLCRTYGSRQDLDEDNYQDMLRYGESLGDGPRFLYLLTFQNHGEWQSNDPEYDTVHVLEDFGEYTDDLNEYLTSIRMSGEAFHELTDRLGESTRPTVVCMVGDHCPSFIRDVFSHPDWSEDEKQLRQRLVPYAVWANFELDLPEQTDYASAVDLMAMVYKAAGLPTSAYQDYILSMHDRTPIRTANGLCMNPSGGIGKISDSPYYDEIHKYYELEYNALNRGSDFRQDLFICPSGQ